MMRFTFTLPRRPLHISPANQMHMEVVHALPSRLAVIYNNSKALKLFLASYSPCDKQQVSQSTLVTVLALGQPCYGLHRENYDVYGRLGVDVIDSHADRNDLI